MALTKDRKKGILMVIAGASMWGGSGVAGQYVLQDCGFSTEWLVVTRMIMAGIIMLALDRVQHSDGIMVIWRSREDVRDLLIFATLGMLMVQYTYFASIKAGNAAAATVLQYLMPAIIIIYMALKTRRAPQKIEILCVVLAIVGTFVLVTHGSLDTLSIPLDALLWGLLSAVAAAIYTTTPKRLIRKWRATLVVGWGMLIGGLVLSPLCPPWQFVGDWQALSALTYAYIIIFGTVVAFGCYLGSTKYIEPTETSILGSVEPLSAIVFSVIFLGASFGVLDIAGTLLIISTVFFLAKR